MSVLLGKRIVCTGSSESDASLIEFLTGEGAEVLQYPCIAIDPVADSSDLDRALADAARDCSRGSRSPAPMRSSKWLFG